MESEEDQLKIGNKLESSVISLTDSLNSSSVLPWDKFSNWIHCICIVTFDLEIGQAIELIYPRHVTLSDTERSNICYLAFPDSNSGCMGDTSYHFRIRQCAKSHSHESSLLQSYNLQAPVALQVDRGHYFGYVYFRQMKDKSIRRGYFQKSVVVLSRLPFINLFTKIVNIIAPEFFDNGEPGLEAACHDIDQWACPRAGEELNLPLMGTVIQTRLPCCTDKLTGSYASPRRDPPTSSEIVHCMLPSVHEVNMYTVFQPILSHIHLLWELVLCSEPVAVMASSPSASSQAVQALTGMIWPLKYSTDFRPFFTIHDSEFKEYTTKTQAPPPVILGVTNPFFAKTLQHWPHIVRFGDTLDSKKVKVRKAGNLKTLDNKPGVYTTYKPFLSKEKTILKKLEQVNVKNGKGVLSNRPVEVQNVMLKRHFVELTHNFIIPLERYVASLMPLQKNINPHKGTPVLGAFILEEFLDSVDPSTLPPILKGDWNSLYRHFCQSPNFQCWYGQKRLEANSKLHELHIRALCETNWVQWTSCRQEVEIVDLIIRMKDKLKAISSSPVPVDEAYIHRLQQHVKDIIKVLPDDLQAVLAPS